MEFIPDYDPSEILGYIKENIKLQLPEVRPCHAHTHSMSVTGGGPSLKDTQDELSGYICTVNGSHDYLLEQGIRPNACGILDPKPEIANRITPQEDVHYYVASMAHPDVFEKLSGYHVIRWHASGLPGIEGLLRAERPDDWYLIGGGSTMGLRWLNLGYVCGFREFHLHGLDSSYQNGNTHAYSDHKRKNQITIDGRKTSPNFMQQVMDFGAVLDRFEQADMDNTDITLYGDGLLQDRYAKHCLC